MKLIMIEMSNRENTEIKYISDLEKSLIFNSTHIYKDKKVFDVISRSSAFEKEGLYFYIYIKETNER